MSDPFDPDITFKSVVLLLYLVEVDPDLPRPRWSEEGNGSGSQPACRSGSWSRVWRSTDRHPGGARDNWMWWVIWKIGFPEYQDPTTSRCTNRLGRWLHSWLRQLGINNISKPHLTSPNFTQPLQTYPNLLQCHSNSYNLNKLISASSNCSKPHPTLRNHSQPHPMSSNLIQPLPTSLHLPKSLATSPISPNVTKTLKTPPNLSQPHPSSPNLTQSLSTSPTSPNLT